MLKRELKPGDVVQIDVDVPVWGGCFLTVVRGRDWGCEGLACKVDGQEQCGMVFLRPTWRMIEFVGRAAWLPEGCGSVNGSGNGAGDDWDMIGGDNDVDTEDDDLVWTESALIRALGPEA